MIKKYKLRVNLAESPAGTVIQDNGSSWMFSSSLGYVYIDHRGSILEGEMAMLLDAMRDRKLTTILQPLPDCLCRGCADDTGCQVEPQLQRHPVPYIDPDVVEFDSAAVELVKFGSLLLVRTAEDKMFSSLDGENWQQFIFKAISDSSKKAGGGQEMVK